MPLRSLYLNPPPPTLTMFKLRKLKTAILIIIRMDTSYSTQDGEYNLFSLPAGSYIKIYITKCPKGKTEKNNALKDVECLIAS